MIGWASLNQRIKKGYSNVSTHVETTGDDNGVLIGLSKGRGPETERCLDERVFMSLVVGIFFFFDFY